MDTKIHYLFSKNKKIGSKLISWGTKHQHKLDETPSHVALLVNERWVFESVLESGVRVLTYKKWLSINQELVKIPCHEGTMPFEHVKQEYKKIKDKKYDWLGVIYLGYRVFLNKLFNAPIPNKNKWENKDKYFCCEAISQLTHVPYYAMRTPVDLMLHIIEKQNLEGQVNI